MKITHLSNSFILIDLENIKICCDPWVGVANNGGWHSFPEYDREALIKSLQEVNYVYISHLHDDHFDSKFLIDSQLINKIILIKKFKFKTLYNKLKSIGANEIIELEPYEIFKIDKVSMSILPQMSSNSDELDEDVEYDIDTSFIVSEENFVFFNQVDNPYSLKDYSDLKHWIDINYGNITIASLLCGAAGEYPQAFLNIDREGEKNNIIDNSLNKLVDTLKVLNPLSCFMAGGTYFIPGKFYQLNSLIAQPTFNQVYEKLKGSSSNVNLLSLEGGNSVSVINSGGIKFHIENNITPICSDIHKSILSHKLDLYDYELEDIIISGSLISQIFEMAKSNWSTIVDDLAIKIEQDIRFFIYDDINYDGFQNKIIGDHIYEFGLESNLDKSLGSLIIHMDLRSFYLCLIRAKIWNGTLGSLCIYDRVPNVFYPSVTFSLNYLVISNIQKDILSV